MPEGEAVTRSVPVNGEEGTEAHFIVPPFRVCKLAYPPGNAPQLNITVEGEATATADGRVVKCFELRPCSHDLLLATDRFSAASLSISLPVQRMHIAVIASRPSPT